MAGKYAEQQRIAVVDMVRPAVVAIFAASGQGGGSGVLISPDGYGLSNFHVTKGAGDSMKCGLADGRLYDAVIVSVDPTGDVALFKMLGRDDFPYVKLGNSDNVDVGDWSFAMGNPFLLATDFKPTVTYGIVSGTHRYQYPAGTLLEYADCIQIDTSINPGNSGGPLFNSQGELIGINGRGSFEKRGRVNVGVGYAISINQIKFFLGHLKSGRIVDHATMGARLGSDENGRVIVFDVLENSDAYRRGLRAGDEVLYFGDREIRTVNEFKNALGIYPRGFRVPLTYRRDGQRFETFVRLRGVHRTGELAKKVGQKVPEDEEDEEKGDDEEKDDQPKQPQPRQIPVGGRGGPAKMPEVVKEVFESRYGYMNFHFNRVHEQRVEDGFAKQGDFSKVAGTWTLSGQDAKGQPFEVSLADESSSTTIAGGKTDLEITSSLTDAREPAGTGGLNAALWFFRRLYTGGESAFGDTVYLGQNPIPGRDGLFDVLLATHAQVECHFYADPETGRLAGLELYPVEDSDPCEVYFAGYEEIDGRWLPRQLTVRYGDREVGVFQVADYKLAEKVGK